MLDWTGVTDLGEQDRVDLVRYLAELTARDFFLLTSDPRLVTPTSVRISPFA